MLVRLSKLFKPDHSAALAAWGRQEGLSFESMRGEDRLVWRARQPGWVLRMESVPPRRPYLRGHELRLRVELGLPEPLALMVMSRWLKLRLEQQAYHGYTETVRTTGKLHLHEESRWLALFGELGWTTMAPDFWARYAVLGERREEAQAWLEGPLSAGLLDWEEAAVGRGAGDSGRAPLVMMLTRGNLYLRTQHERADAAQLSRVLELARLAAHRAQIFAGFGLSSLV